jgi:hypothetical protein
MAVNINTVVHAQYDLVLYTEAPVPGRTGGRYGTSSWE